MDRVLGWLGMNKNWSRYEEASVRITLEVLSSDYEPFAIVPSVKRECTKLQAVILNTKIGCITLRTSFCSLHEVAFVSQQHIYILTCVYYTCI